MPKEHFDTLTNYLANILEQGKEHQEKFTLKLKDCTIENLSAGVLRLLPENTEKDSPLVLSCGVHGNETAPIEILNDILSDIASEKLSLKRPCLFIFGHLAAMRAHKRFIDFNMNRLFCGVHEKYPEAQESKRAKELEDFVSDFFSTYGNGHHYDLHTAIRPSHLRRFAVFPTSGNAQPNDEEIHSLKAMGIEGLLVAGGKASTFSAYTHSVHQAKGYTLELGKVEPFGENNRSNFKQAESFLRATISQGSSQRNSQDVSHETNSSEKLKIYNVDHEMIRDSENYVLHLSEDYANFTPLKEGERIETTDAGTLTAKEGQAVVFPNSQVVVGQRTGLLVSVIKEI